MEITTSEVPTAAGMGSPPSRASAGTRRNPPPAPTSPLISPTVAPCSTILTTGSGPADSSPRSLRPRSMAIAAKIMISAKAMSRMLPGTKCASRPPVNAPAMAAAPNTAAIFQRTRPARAWAIAPTALVTPTTSSEVAMAPLASMPAT